MPCAYTCCINTGADLCHPDLSRGREQFLCRPRHYLSLPYHTSGFAPIPSLLTTGLSFWGCHINRTTFLIAFGSSSQVKSGTTIFKERWAGSWEGKEASITTAISLLCRDSPWDKLLHEHLGSSDDNCQEWGEAQIFSSREAGQYVVHWLREMLLSTSKAS